MAAPAVEARGWGWRHAGRRGFAVRDLDLRVEHGERVLLLGASGAGKSTLLWALAGLLRAPDAGDEEGLLLVDGAPAGGRDSASHSPFAHTGLVFQDPSSAIVMGRVGDEVAFGLENRAVPLTEIWPRVSEVLTTVGLRYDLLHPTDRLSGGEQQRLVIADVLALRPAIWLLDEPTANLDPPGAAMVRATLRHVVGESGATLVLVEHRVSELVDLVTRVVVLESGGGVMADGDPRQVFGNPSTCSALRRAGVWLPEAPPGRLAPRRPAGPPVIEAADVTVRYEGAAHPAVDGIDLIAHSGQVLAVTGPNGSGKTTLSLVLASLMRPTSGEVRWRATEGGAHVPPSKPYARWRPRELVRHVGTVFQDPEHQFVAPTVAGELAVGPRRAGQDARTVDARVGELLERLGLGALAAANPYTLSGGEQRRLSAASALAARPQLLVLDEPTFGQDSRTWSELAALLAEERDAGRAVLTVTHDEDLVRALADEEVVLEDGRRVDEDRRDASAPSAPAAPSEIGPGSTPASRPAQAPSRRPSPTATQMPAP